MSDMIKVTEQTSRIIDALTDAILATAATAAEKIHLAAQVAQVQQRMAAFQAVLEVVGVQKEALIARLTQAKGPMAAMLTRQIEVLTEQELKILESAGAPEEAARQAVQVIEYAPEPPPAGKTVVRKHNRRLPIAINGHQED